MGERFWPCMPTQDRLCNMLEAPSEHYPACNCSLSDASHMTTDLSSMGQGLKGRVTLRKEVLRNVCTHT